MSLSVDNRVVSMAFEDKGFEKGVESAIKSLDELQDALDFEEVIENLDSFKKEFKFSDEQRSLKELRKVVDDSLNFDKNTSKATGIFGKIKNGINDVQNSLSELGVFGLSIINGFGNEISYKITGVINSLASSLKSITIDPIKMGLSEYETQIGGVQTILANTASKGTTIDQVTVALEELNEYADYTIYVFAEMVKNIGTFTAAGVELDKSVNAIKGIANLGAMVGSTSTQVSNAMYQMSQGLSAGTIKLLDWKSIENAGMGGEKFREAIMRTARTHGVAIDQIIADEGSFRDSLSKGWLTAEIMLESLNQFTQDVTADEWRALGYSEEDIKIIEDLGETATNAATKVKTFTQFKSTFMENLQSGWTMTWQYILGDFEEAQKFWTEVSNSLNGIVSAISDARNKLVKAIMGPQIAASIIDETEFVTSGLEDLTNKLNGFEDALIEAARKHGIAIDEMIESSGSLKATLGEGWLNTDIFEEASRAYTDKATMTKEELEKLIASIWRGDWGYTDEEQDSRLIAAGYDMVMIQDLLDQMKASGWEYGTYYIEDYDAFLRDVIVHTEEETAALTALQKLTSTQIVDPKFVDMEQIRSALDGTMSDTFGLEEYLKMVFLESRPDMAGIFENGFEASFDEEQWLTSEILAEAIDRYTKAVQVSRVDVDWVLGQLQTGNYGWTEEEQRANLQAIGYNADVVLALAKQVSETGSYQLDDYRKIIQAFVDDNGNIQTWVTAVEAMGELAKDEDSSLSDLMSHKILTGRDMIVETLFNYFDALKKIFEAVANAWRDVFPEISVERIQDIIKSIYEFSEGLDTALKPAINLIGIVAKAMFTILRVAITGIGNIVSFVVSGIGTIASYVKDGKILGFVINAIQKILEPISKLNELIHFDDMDSIFSLDTLTAVADVFTEIKKNVADLFTTTFPGLVKTFDQIKEKVNEFLNSDNPFVVWFYDSKIYSGLQFILEKINEIKTFILGDLLSGEGTSELVSAVSSMMTTVKEKIQLIKAFIDNVLYGEGLDVDYILSTISNFFTRVKTFVTTKIAEIKQTISDSINNAGGIVGIINKVLSILTTGIRFIISTIGIIITNGIPYIAEIIGSIGSSVFSTFSTILSKEGLLGFLSGSVGFVDSIVNIFHSLQLDELLSSIIPNFEQIKSAAISLFNDFSLQNIIDNFMSVTGLSETVSQVKASVSDAVGTVRDELVSDAEAALSDILGYADNIEVADVLGLFGLSTDTSEIESAVEEVGTTIAEVVSATGEQVMSSEMTRRVSEAVPMFGEMMTEATTTLSKAPSSKTEPDIALQSNVHYFSRKSGQALSEEASIIDEVAGSIEKESEILDESVETVRNIAYARDVLISRGTDSAEELSDSLDTISENSNPIVSSVTTLYGTLKSALSSSGNGLLSGIESFAESFDPLSGIIVKIREFIDWIKSLNFVDLLFKFIGGGLTAVGTGTLIYSLYKLVGLVKKGISLVELAEKYIMESAAAKNKEAIALIIASIGSSVKAIGVGMLALAASMLILSKIDTNRLKESVILLGILMGIITACITVMSVVGKDQLSTSSVQAKTKAFSKIAKSMLIIALAILIIAKPIKELGEMRPESLIQGLEAFGIILIALAVAMKILSTNKKSLDTAAKSVTFDTNSAGFLNILAFAIAIKLLAGVLLELSQYDEFPTTGLLLTGLLAAIETVGISIINYTSASTTFDKAAGNALEMLAFAQSISMIADTLIQIADYATEDKMDQLEAGAAAVAQLGVMLTVFTGIVNISNGLDFFHENTSLIGRKEKSSTTKIKTGTNNAGATLAVAAEQLTLMHEFVDSIDTLITDIMALGESDMSDSRLQLATDVVAQVGHLIEGFIAIIDGLNIGDQLLITKVTKDTVGKSGLAGWVGLSAGALNTGEQILLIETFVDEISTLMHDIKTLSVGMTSEDMQAAADTVSQLGMLIIGFTGATSAENMIAGAETAGFTVINPTVGIAQVAGSVTSAATNVAEIYTFVDNISTLVNTIINISKLGLTKARVEAAESTITNLATTIYTFLGISFAENFVEGTEVGVLEILEPGAGWASLAGFATSAAANMGEIIIFTDGLDQLVDAVLKLQGYDSDDVNHAVGIITSIADVIEQFVQISNTMNGAGLLGEVFISEYTGASLAETSSAAAKTVLANAVSSLTSITSMANGVPELVDAVIKLADAYDKYDLGDMDDETSEIRRCLDIINAVGLMITAVGALADGVNLLLTVGFTFDGKQFSAISVTTALTNFTSIETMVSGIKQMIASLIDLAAYLSGDDTNPWDAGDEIRKHMLGLDAETASERKARREDSIAQAKKLIEDMMELITSYARFNLWLGVIFGYASGDQAVEAALAGNGWAVPAAWIGSAIALSGDSALSISSVTQGITDIVTEILRLSNAINENDEISENGTEVEGSISKATEVVKTILTVLTGFADLNTLMTGLFGTGESAVLAAAYINGGDMAAKWGLSGEFVAAGVGIGTFYADLKIYVQTIKDIVSEIIALANVEGFEDLDIDSATKVVTGVGSMINEFTSSIFESTEVPDTAASLASSIAGLKGNNVVSLATAASGPALMIAYAISLVWIMNEYVNAIKELSTSVTDIVKDLNGVEDVESKIQTAFDIIDTITQKILEFVGGVKQDAAGDAAATIIQGGIGLGIGSALISGAEIASGKIFGKPAQEAITAAKEASKGKGGATGLAALAAAFAGLELGDALESMGLIQSFSDGLSAVVGSFSNLYDELVKNDIDEDKMTMTYGVIDYISKIISSFVEINTGANNLQEYVYSNDGLPSLIAAFKNRGVGYGIGQLLTNVGEGTDIFATIESYTGGITRIVTSVISLYKEIVKSVNTTTSSVSEDTDTALDQSEEASSELTDTEKKIKELFTDENLETAMLVINLISDLIVSFVNTMSTGTGLEATLSSLSTLVGKKGITVAADIFLVDAGSALSIFAFIEAFALGVSQISSSIIDLFASLKTNDITVAEAKVIGSLIETIGTMITTFAGVMKFIQEGGEFFNDVIPTLTGKTGADIKGNLFKIGVNAIGEAVSVFAIVEAFALGISEIVNSLASLIDVIDKVGVESEAITKAEQIVAIVGIVVGILAAVIAILIDLKNKKAIATAGANSDNLFDARSLNKFLGALGVGGAIWLILDALTSGISDIMESFSNFITTIALTGLNEDELSTALNIFIQISNMVAAAVGIVFVILEIKDIYEKYHPYAKSASTAWYNADAFSDVGEALKEGGTVWAVMTAISYGIGAVKDSVLTIAGAMHENGITDTELTTAVNVVKSIAEMLESFTAIMAVLDIFKTAITEGVFSGAERAQNTMSQVSDASGKLSTKTWTSIANSDAATEITASLGQSAIIWTSMSQLVSGINSLVPDIVMLASSIVSSGDPEAFTIAAQIIVDVGTMLAHFAEIVTVIDTVKQISKNIYKTFRGLSQGKLQYNEAQAKQMSKSDTTGDILSTLSTDALLFGAIMEMSLGVTTIIDAMAPLFEAIGVGNVDPTQIKAAGDVITTIMNILMLFATLDLVTLASLSVSKVTSIQETLANAARSFAVGYGQSSAITAIGDSVQAIAESLYTVSSIDESRLVGAEVTVGVISAILLAIGGISTAVLTGTASVSLVGVGQFALITAGLWFFTSSIVNIIDVFETLADLEGTVSFGDILAWLQDLAAELGEFLDIDLLGLFDFSEYRVPDTQLTDQLEYMVEAEGQIDEVTAAYSSMEASIRENKKAEEELALAWNPYGEGLNIASAIATPVLNYDDMGEYTQQGVQALRAHLAEKFGLDLETDVAQIDKNVESYFTALADAYSAGDESAGDDLLYWYDTILIEGRLRDQAEENIRKAIDNNDWTEIYRLMNEYREQYGDEAFQAFSGLEIGDTYRIDKSMQALEEAWNANYPEGMSTLFPAHGDNATTSTKIEMPSESAPAELKYAWYKYVAEQYDALNGDEVGTYFLENPIELDASMVAIPNITIADIHYNTEDLLGQMLASGWTVEDLEAALEQGFSIGDWHELESVAVNNYLSSLLGSDTSELYIQVGASTIPINQFVHDAIEKGLDAQTIAGYIQQAFTTGDANGLRIAMESVGADAIWGIAEGEKDEAGNLNLEGVGITLVNKAMEAIGAASPAKKFYPVGRYAILGILEGMKQGAKNCLSAIKIAANILLNKSGKSYKQVGESLAESLNAGLESGVDSTDNTVDTMMNTSMNTAKKLAKDYYDTGYSVDVYLSDGIYSGSYAVTNAVSSLFTSNNKLKTDKYWDYYNVGTYIAKGLAQGINDNKNEPITAAINLVADVDNNTKKYLGIASPSKVFKEIGMYSDYGLRDGFLQYSNCVTEASELVAEDAVDSMNRMLYDIASNIDPDMDLQPTIRPILDLTDISHGAQSIDSMFAARSSIGLAATVSAGSLSKQGVYSDYNNGSSNIYNVNVEFSGPVNREVDIESAIMTTFSKMQMLSRM